MELAGWRQSWFKRTQALLVVLYAASLPISLTASWIILSLGLLVWVGQIIAETVQLRCFPHDFVRPPLCFALAIFALAILLSGLAVGGIAEGLNSLVSLRALIVYFWAFQTFAKQEGIMLLAVQTLLGVGALAGIAGAVEQIFNFHPFGYAYLQGTGFLGGPMAYAGQMQILSLLALAIFLKRSNQQFRFGLSRHSTYLLITAANLLGVLFASERNAWLGFAAGVLALTATLSWRSLVKGSLVLILVSFLCWSFVPVVHTRIALLSNWQQDISVRVRLRIWQESIKLWHSAPVFGIGIRHFPHFDIPEAIVPGHSKDINHAHSNYLHILSTTGLVGLSAYLWLWFSALKIAWTAAKYSAMSPQDMAISAIALGVLAGSVALMVSGIFEYNFGASQIRLIQWFVLAMLPNTSVHGKGSRPLF